MHQAEFEFDEAEADFQQALERLESTPDDELHYVLLVNRGLIRFQRGRLDQAAADYQEAIRLKKDPFLAHAELAHVYQKQDKPTEAIEQFTRAIALKPDWPPLYRGRAEVLASSRRLDPGAAPGGPGRSEDGDPPRDSPTIRSWPRTIPIGASCSIATSDSKMRSRKASSPCEVLPDTIDRRSRPSDPGLAQVEALRRGDPLVRRRPRDGQEIRGALRAPRPGANAAHHDYPGAIRDYGRALEIRPDDGRLLARRGWAYLVFDSPKLALADFEAAIKLDPADGDAYNGRGTAHARLGDHRAAVADAREALRLGEANPRVTYNAARIYALAASSRGCRGRREGPPGQAACFAKYQDMAVQLIREAFEREAPEKRAAFWRETVQPDPALKAIRRRLKFEDLIATSK